MNKGKVLCYWNLHKKCWSVKRGKERVVHYNELALENVTFKVWEKSRQTTIKEKQKRVHAFACGIIGKPPNEKCQLVQISYNPYKGGYFYRKDNGDRIDEAIKVILTPRGEAFALLVA